MKGIYKLSKYTKIPVATKDFVAGGKNIASPISSIAQCIVNRGDGLETR
jgi:hypothetical protein